MNCKPGDLAWIVRDDYPENLGLVVKVGERADAFLAMMGVGELMGPSWNIVSEGRPLTVTHLTVNVETGYFACTKGQKAMSSVCEDVRLRPLRGESDVIDVEMTEPAPA